MRLFRGLAVCILMVSSAAGAAARPEFPSEAARTFIEREAQNDFKPDTTVQKRFQPGAKTLFRVKYSEIPMSELHLVLGAPEAPDVAQHLIVERGGNKYVRFFIHPDSEKLYAPLLKKYPPKGYYWASPTASTRTLLAWDPKRPRGPPVFLKLSLAQYQDRLGRIIPGWEVRRSVGISALASMTPAETWLKSGSWVIPEVGGAYVSEKHKLAFKVDSKQPRVLEHGFIVRSASFLDMFPGKEVIPMTALFSARGKRPPMIVELWQDSGKPFTEFVRDFLVRPMLEKNRRLFFTEGIIPEIHAQNIVVVLDPKPREITHFLHRDVGSMKVDLRLRWINGLPVTPLRSPNAAFDFKFERATEVLESYFNDYFYHWIFEIGYGESLAKYVPGYDSEAIQELIHAELRAEVERSLPIRKKLPETAPIADHLRQYYRENAPAGIRKLDLRTSPERLEAFIRSQKKAGQVMPLPAEWAEALDVGRDRPVVTDYGVVFQDGKQLRLAFHRSADLSEIRRTPRIGIYTGTFDPPHAGHRGAIEKARAELDLDLLYVFPNFDPGHKPDASRFIHRKRMAELAFGDIPGVSLKEPRLEAALKAANYDELARALTELHPGADFYQVMGDDSWAKYRRYLGMRKYPGAHVAVVVRNGDIAIPKKLGQVPVIRVEAPAVTYSSTEAREALAKGKRPKQVSPSVLDYAEEMHIYRKCIPRAVSRRITGVSAPL